MTYFTKGFKRQTWTF